MKAMCISGMVFGGIIFIIFALDLTPLKLPFYQPSKTMDIGFMIAGLLMAYMGWSALRATK